MRALLLWVGLSLAALAQDEPFVPRASHTDKPAVFGYMILQKQADIAGVPTRRVYRMAIAPWSGLALLILFRALDKRYRYNLIKNAEKN